MARLILRLFYDPHGARRDILVDLASDADTVAFEHEQQHKSLLDRILNVGGFSDAVFGVVTGFLTNDANRFVAEVESIEL